MKKFNVIALVLALITSVLLTGAAFAGGQQPATKKTVSDIRVKYPTPLGATHGQFLIEVACATGKGLLKKDWGTFVRLPNGVGVAQDIMAEPNGIHYDILGDGENSAIPNWDLVVKEGTDEPLLVDTNRYYLPNCTGLPEVPAPPTPDNTELDQLKTRIAALEAELAAMHQSQVAISKQRDDAQYKVAELENVISVHEAKATVLEVKLEAANNEIAALQNVSCEAKVPGWLKAIGLRVGCQIIR